MRDAEVCRIIVEDNPSYEQIIKRLKKQPNGEYVTDVCLVCGRYVTHPTGCTDKVKTRTICNHWSPSLLHERSMKN